MVSNTASATPPSTAASHSAPPDHGDIAIDSLDQMVRAVRGLTTNAVNANYMLTLATSAIVNALLDISDAIRENSTNGPE